jgi:VWFA-related protein
MLVATMRTTPPLDAYEARSAMAQKPRLVSRRLLRRLVVFPLLGLLAAPIAGDDAPVFIERIDVSVVNVEVFVTDREGRPVPGLVAEDFEILVDGQPVEITNFFAFTDGNPIPVGDLDEDGQADTPQGPAAPSVPVRAATPLPEEQRLHLVVYVDHFNIGPASRKRALEDVRRFIDHRVSQGDQVMIAGYDGSLRIDQTFTRNILLLEQALAGMERVAAHRQRDDSERQRVIRQMNIDSGRGVGGLRDAHALVRSYVQSARHDLRRSVEALGTVARSLSGLPGRKALLYVSDGLPKRPGEELYQHLNDLFDPTQFREAGEGQELPEGTIDPYLEALKQDESQLYDEIVRHANAHQVTYYTLDARGTGGESLSAARTGDLAGEGGRATFEALRTSNLQEPLVDLAESTGGAAILNSNNFADALDDMAEAFDSFYSLGFHAREEDEGKYRQIRVRLRRPDVQIRHRLGFMDKAPLDRIGDRTLSSLLLEASSNPLQVRVELGVPVRQARNRYVLPVLVRIPISQVTLIPQGDVYQGRLSFFVTVQDADGEVSDVHHTPYPITIPADQMTLARQREIGHGMNLRVAAGEPKIAIGVWDELSGTETFVRYQVEVGPR